MAHYFKIENDIVITGVVVSDEREIQLTESGIVDWLNGLFGGTWLKSVKDGTMRKNYAYIGGTYDVIRDAFIQPKPFASWALDETTARWKPPTKQPTDRATKWNETTKEWVNM